MLTFKCKMCGGTLEISNNETVATCEYCGTQQTLPKLDDDKRANMYDRANHFRRNNEFDKAMGIYEQILNEDNTDAEAYWSLVLCRYGIEYVEDPASHKRVPTVNRAQFTSIFDDEDYKSALKNSDTLQKNIYEAEAKTINEIQKGILAISQKEEPFDVFICYKETDNNGRRTPDSVLANDIYHQLTQEGFKVFFARITLEDKLGSAYEPYIFAALNSAKVMVVLGTKPEYFNAVWVKNEWSRYLTLIKQGQKKILIPAYKDMDPYDLPDEFSHLQAQDMSKLGFMQDLIRGIKKIAQDVEPKATVIKETVVTKSNASNNTAPLLERAFMFLEDGNWESADEYCEKVLDIEPKNAQAYLGKLMAELQVKNQDLLRDSAEPFDNSNNYQKALRFGDETLQSTLAGYIEYINTRNENRRLEVAYIKAKAAMHTAKTEFDYRAVSKTFSSLKEYKDSAKLSEECMEKAETARKDAILNEGKARTYVESVDNYEAAILLFKRIPGWKDADECVELYQKKIDEIIAREEAEREAAEERDKRNKKIAIIIISAMVVFLVFLLILFTVIIPNTKYNDAIALMESGKYDEAILAFTELDGYKDSAEKITECRNAIRDGIYEKALDLMESGKYEEAILVFTELDGYKDSAEKIREAEIEKTKESLKTLEVGDTLTFGMYEQNNNLSDGDENIEWIVLEIKDGKVLLLSKYALDCQPYNTTFTDITWETCTLRKWLNDEFINSAFPDTGKSMISTVTVSADKNPSYSTNPGNNTQDKVFLLSITEANKYFGTIGERKCEPTAYTVANGAYETYNGNCSWWLRSPGGKQYSAAYVYADGDVSSYGDYVMNDDNAVRPALWIDLNA